MVGLGLDSVCCVWFAPSQIVAGLEPENTNVFLQMLASACRQGPAEDIVQVRLDECVVGYCAGKDDGGFGI